MTRQTSWFEFRGDDFELLSELRQKVVHAERRAVYAEQYGDEAARAGDDEAAEVVEALAAVEAAAVAAAERGTEWRLCAIGHREFRALLAAHPPRTELRGEGDDAVEVIHHADEEYGVNTDTFGLELVLWRDPAEADHPVDDFDPEDPPHRTVITPALEPAALERRVRRLSEAEFRTLWKLAEALNSGRYADPKALLYGRS